MKKKRKICLLLLLFFLAGTIHMTSVTVYADEDNGFTESETIKEKAKEYKDKDSDMEPISALIIWVLLATAFLKVAQQLDSILRSIGIGTSAGNGRGSALNTAMQMIRTVESVSKMYRNNAKALAGLSGNTNGNGGMQGNSPNSDPKPGFQNGGASNMAREFASSMFQSNDGASSPITGEAAQHFMSGMFGDKFSDRVVTDPSKIDELAAQQGMEGKDSGMWVDMGKDENGEQQYANISNLSWGNGVTGEFNGKPFQILNDEQFSELSSEEQQEYGRFAMTDGSDAYMKWETGAAQEDGMRQAESSSQPMGTPSFMNQEEGTAMQTEQQAAYENALSFQTNMEGNEIQTGAASFQTEQDASFQTDMGEMEQDVDYENASSFYHEEANFMEGSQAEAEDSIYSSGQEPSFQNDIESSGMGSTEQTAEGENAWPYFSGVPDSVESNFEYYSYEEPEMQGETPAATGEGNQSSVSGQDTAYHQPMADTAQTAASFSSYEAQEGESSQRRGQESMEGGTGNTTFHVSGETGGQNAAFYQQNDSQNPSFSFEPASSHQEKDSKLDLGFQPGSESASFTQDHNGREV